MHDDAILRPDPDGVHVEETGFLSWHLTAEVWHHGNRRNRIRRMMAIRENLKRNGWRCEWCGERIGTHKRADARYCRERCRKAAARARTANR